MMEINRRAFLGLLTAAGAVAAMPALANQSRAIPGVYASASRGEDGRYYLNVVAQDALRVTHLLPERAHQVLFHPKQPWVIAVARRPGTFIDIVDYDSGLLVKQIVLAKGHYLYGHVQVTADGRYLLTTEKHPDQQEGQVVVRDLRANFDVVQRYSTGGIGPHELKLTADQSEVVIANGGILTEGREKLNLETMQPSLAYLNLASGKIVEQVALDERYHQSSIRHFDLSANGDVLIAMQYQGHPADDVPLVAHHRRGQPLTALDIPTPVRTQLKQYCGSACFDSTGRFGAVSAPRGNRVMFWDMTSGQYLSDVKTKDGCGLAPTDVASEFIVSTGRGRFYRVNAATAERQRLSLPGEAIWQWDNHMVRLAG
ncbi:DUF1513 domain-containing protein [Neptunomonas marina]|uniref:DUF1513 domain-containing protein n=2 Tax=Neptunomonas marina TaxID=1815562 RepID=A0A437QAJ6_9GAMM|nr:DUF1513 domain-containing protein [Neptunomonas marina]